MLREGFEVEAVVFDDGVGEELVAHFADLGGGGGFVSGLEGDFHVLAGADGLDGVEAELVKAAEDGLALGVADGGAVLDIDFGEVHSSLSVSQFFSLSVKVDGKDRADNHPHPSLPP